MDAICEPVIAPPYELLQFGVARFGLVTLAAIVLFCAAMGWFCAESAATWAAKIR